jgi:capsular exopolysaccharide synthesis family protein
MNADLATARTARIQAEQRWRSAAGTPVMSLPEVIENGTISGLRSERSRLESELSKLLQTFGDDYPEVGQVRSQLAAVDGQITTIANQVKNSIRERYQVAARQEAAIAGRMGGLRSETLQDQDRRVRFDILNRDAATNRELYASLLQRYRQVSTAAGVTNNNISILDRAIPPSSPIKPRPLFNLALAALAGLGLGLLLAFIRERLTDTLRTPDDVTSKLKQPLLGTTPKLPGKMDVNEALTASTSSISEAYHSVRSSIEFSSAAGLPKTLLITSSRPGEGKSTTALAVAADFARFGRNVLLVDADLRMPSLHKTLDVRNDVGLVNVIVGKTKLQDAVVGTGGLMFLPSGPIPPNPAELLAPHIVARFVDEALARYDIVIFDGPPVLGLADAPQIGRIVEGTVLVLEADGAHRGQAKTAIKRLEAANARVLGVVLSKFNAAASGYGDQYGYNYSYGESKKLSAS